MSIEVLVQQRVNIPTTIASSSCETISKGIMADNSDTTTL